MKIGQAIAAFRKKKGVYQKDMADALKISVTYLSLVENSKENPSMKLLSATAEYLNIPVSALFFAVLEEKHYKSEKARKVFKTAKPVVEKVIDMLISESASIKSKSSLPVNLPKKVKG